MIKIGAIVFLCISLVIPASTPPTPLYIVAGQSNAWPTAKYTSNYLEGFYVDCSKGGSSISAWIPTGYLYKRCVDYVKELLETKTSQVLAEDGKVFGGWRDDRTNKISDGYWTLENGKAKYTHSFYNQE